MTTDEAKYLTEVEEELKRKFTTGEKKSSRLPSNARESAQSERIHQLALPLNERPRMPYTQEKYIVRENPHLVAWERETRRFLRNLPLNTGHRVSAVMVYEWVTGISPKDIMDAGGTASHDLRKINSVLKFYFNKSYATYIMGRKVPNAYRVPAGWRIKRHRPMTLTLYAEYCEGTLNP